MWNAVCRCLGPMAVSRGSWSSNSQEYEVFVGGLASQQRQAVMWTCETSYQIWMSGGHELGGFCGSGLERQNTEIAQ